MSSSADLISAAAPGPARFGDQLVKTADDGHRDPGRLLLDQVRGGGDLVGDRRHRHLEQVPERVTLPAMIAQRDDSGRADGCVGLARPPRPAHGVGDDHAEPRAGPLADRLAQCLGRRVRVEREQDQGPRLGVRLINSGRGHDQAVPGLADGGRPPARDHADGLGPDRGVPVAAHHPVLGLADDLGGDDHDVTVLQARSGQRGLGDERGQVRAGGDLGQPGYRQDRELRGRRRVVLRCS